MTFDIATCVTFLILTFRAVLRISEEGKVLLRDYLLRKNGQKCGEKWTNRKGYSEKNKRK